MKPQRSPAIDFLLLASAWGSSFLFMRMGALEFGAWATAGLRVAFAALALLPLLLWRCDLQLVRRKAGPLLAVGLLNTALPFTFYCYALQHISTGLTSILNASSPLFGALVAWAWLREAPGRWRTLGLAIAGFGLIFIGIETLQAGMQTVQSRFDLGKLPAAGVLGHLAAMVLGIFLTIVMQSSSAAVAKIGRAHV